MKQSNKCIIVYVKHNYVKSNIMEMKECEKIKMNV